MPMYAVTQGFLDKIKANNRRVYGKVAIDYTDPFLDQSIQVTASEQASVSYPAQTADAVAEPFAKIASLDGSWVLDGTYALAPGPDEAKTMQMGWWGSQLAQADGTFVAPYPTLTVTFFSRPITQLKVVGDNKRGEYPVDFVIRLYNSANTLLHEEIVTDNTSVTWQKTLTSAITQVTKMVLEIRKWSHPGRQAKILEFFTSIQETYEGDDVLLIRLLEEREVSQGSLPVGNISANEIDIRLSNETRKFDAGNTQSPLYQLLKQNRRIRAWLGTGEQGDEALLDDFSDPQKSQALWEVQTYGGNGAQQYASGESILTPEQGLINSVTMRAHGSFRSVKVRAKLESDGVNPTRYLDICIGSGPIVDTDDGTDQKWWHTALAYGYVLGLQTEGASNGLVLSRRDGPGVKRVALGYGQAPADWTTQYHDYEIQIYEGGVRFLVDGAVVGDFKDTRYSAGDILISQGEYLSGAGAILHVDSVHAATGVQWVPLGTFWSGDWSAPEDGVYAQTTGRDRLELLRKSTYSTSTVQVNKTLYDLAVTVLQDAGLKPEEYWVDTELQQYTVPYAYFEPMSHREALRLIAEACLGQVYCDRNGVVRVEGPSFLVSKTTSDLTLTADDYFRKDNPVKWSEIANYVEVETQPLRPVATAQEVYRSNEPVPIAAGERKTITAYYNEVPCIEATASLEGAPSGCVIESVTYYAWGAEVKVYSPNAGSFTLVVNAKPLKVMNKERAVAKDDASITDNGLIRYTFPPNPLVQTLSMAQTIADTLLASFRNPRRNLEMEWRGNPALLLGDRITVVDRNEQNDYFVTRQEIDWTGALRARLSGRRVI